MTGLLIKGGRIVDPASSLDSLRDLRIRDGRIAQIGEHLERDADEEVIEATGTVVTPGLVDMHVHLREPGFPQKETIATGTEAAVRGGFTSIACMPNTKPALDEPDVLEWLVKEVERHARCRVYPIAAVTRGRRSEEPTDLLALVDAGAVAFSDDGDTVTDAAVMRDAALKARELSAPIIAHCQPEVEIVARDLAIARDTGKRWHVAHVSTAEALELIRRARSDRVTCEATPHHLAFTSALLAELGPAATVNPPLRTEADVQALRQGVRDGSIDALASDHAPHTEQEKRGDAAGRAAPGFSGLEIAIGAYAAALPDLPLPRFVELVSTNPARILGLPAGTLALGEAADVTIFAERPWVVDPATFASKGKCTPFAGRRLPRKVLATIVGGIVRYRAPDLAA